MDVITDTVNRKLTAFRSFHLKCKSHEQGQHGRSSELNSVSKWTNGDKTLTRQGGVSGSPIWRVLL